MKLAASGKSKQEILQCIVFTVAIFVGSVDVVVCCLLFLLFVVCWCWLLLVCVCWCCLLSFAAAVVVCCLLFVVCCLLFLVCCLLFVVVFVVLVLLLVLLVLVLVGGGGDVLAVCWFLFVLLLLPLETNNW